MMDLDKEFPQSDSLYYLNHAAVSPWPRRTADAIDSFANENVLWGAKNYPDWMEKETELRKQLQSLIHANSRDEIALLKNTSEALSVVAEGINWHSGDNIVSSDQEFPSNRIPWQAQEKHGVVFREVDLNTDESPELALINACNSKTRILTISSVQYSTGLRLDLEKLGQFCRSENILFCVDAIQSLGAHDINVETAFIDFMMADAHKWLMGPEGIALFYCRKELQEKLKLHQYGWHMIQTAGNYDDKSWQPASNARRFECGSPNMLGIHGMSASLSLILQFGIENIEKEIAKHADFLLQELKSSGFEILSPEEERRRAGIVTFTAKGKDMPGLQQELMQRNVICAYRGGGIRFSPHFYTKHSVLEKALEVLNITI